jgi:hypothetical protein
LYLSVARIRGYHSVAADAARVLQAISIAHARRFLFILRLDDVLVARQI